MRFMSPLKNNSKTVLCDYCVLTKTNSCFLPLEKYLPTFYTSFLKVNMYFKWYTVVFCSGQCWLQLTINIQNNSGSNAKKNLGSIFVVCF